LISFGILLLLGFLAGFYFYNYYVFETVEICVGDYNEVGQSCETVQDCFDLLEDYEETFNEVNFSDFGEYGNLSDLPDFAKERLFEFSEDLVSCDGVCKVRPIEGFNSKYLENWILEDCSESGKTLSIELRGKDVLEIFQFLKK
jgi:hypothetical protein